MLKYFHEFSFVRDAHFAVPTFDFYFRVALPRARKEREIIERDFRGRILHSRVPEYPNYALNLPHSGIILFNVSQRT